MSAHQPSDKDLLAALGYRASHVCELLVDPCIALDVLGLWLTMRVACKTDSGLEIHELDVHLPVGQDGQKVELGHQSAACLLGDFAQQRVLRAVRSAMALPMQLVIELNGSTHGVELMLESSGRPKYWALRGLARMVDATHHEMVESVVAFRVPDPQTAHLQILARVFFGEPWARLFEGC